MFERYGAIKSVSLIRDIVTGFSRRYAFIEFKDSHECERARRKTHKTILNGKEILVDFECQQTLPGWVPRRLGIPLSLLCSNLKMIVFYDSGGGFGGRKESGQLRFGCLDRPWKKPIALQYADQEFQTKYDKDLYKHESSSRHTSNNSEKHGRHHHHERKRHGSHREDSSKKRKK